MREMASKRFRYLIHPKNQRFSACSAKFFQGAPGCSFLSAINHQSQVVHPGISFIDLTFRMLVITRICHIILGVERFHPPIRCTFFYSGFHLGHGMYLKGISGISDGILPSSSLPKVWVTLWRDEVGRSMDTSLKSNTKRQILSRWHRFHV